MWALGLALLLFSYGDDEAAKPLAVDLSARLKVPGVLVLQTRARQADAAGIEQVVEGQTRWQASETAIVVCDMWDRHWCAGASRRVGIMAPRMNEVLDAARQRGVFIVHAPSDTITFYEGTLPRRRLQEAPAAQPPVAIPGWCRLDPAAEGPLPIDDADGGCDCWPTCPNYKAWSRQHPALDVAQEDGVSDNGAEIYNYLQQQGIRNVVLMGVHTNMCVLGRSFGIRQMTKLGFNVVLARDLTDTMYNPRSRPYVSHARGTELVVEHVERHWCPTISSVDLRSVETGSDGP